jgi:hypothetical protein
MVCKHLSQTQRYIITTLLLPLGNISNMNITVKPVGGFGREAEPGRMAFPSSVEIKPRLRAFFSSRLFVVEAGQSPGAGPAVGASGAGGTGGAGVEAKASNAPLLGAPDVALAAAALVVAPAASVRFLFFTIVGKVLSEKDPRTAAAAQRL